MPYASNQNSINIDSIEPNSVVLIEGIIGYSHITTKVAGDELQAVIQRRNMYNQIPPTREYTTMTLHSVNVLLKDPKNPTLAEQYINSRCYTSRNTDRNPGWCYTGENKGLYLPAIGVRNQDGSYSQIYPEAELAPGQKVIMVVRIFKGRLGNGCTFDAVLIPSGEAKLMGMGGNQLANELAQFGIVWHAAESQEAASEPNEAQVAATMSLDSVMGAAAMPAPATAMGAMPGSAVGQTRPSGISYDPDAQ